MSVIWFWKKWSFRPYFLFLSFLLCVFCVFPSLVDAPFFSPFFLLLISCLFVGRTLNVHMVFSSVLFSGVFFLSFLPPADCCCGLLKVGLKCPLPLLSGNSQILFQFIQTVMDWRVLHTYKANLLYILCLFYFSMSTLSCLCAL